MESVDRPWRSELSAAGLLAALVLLSLGGSLAGGFVWDDAPLIVDNRLVQEPEGLREILTSSFWETGDRHDRFQAFFRPLVSLSYALDYAIWGPNPFGFHLTNLLLHFLCCWLVFQIALHEGVSRAAALVGAGLFAAHPVHVESVAWISGRTDLLCGVLMLAAFLWHQRAMQGDRLAGPRVAALACFGAALFAKEMAATLPALIFGERWLSGGQVRGRWRRAWSSAWPFFVVFALYMGVRSTVLGAGGAPVFTLGLESWAASALFVMARYLTLLLLPLGLDAHYPYEAMRSLFAVPVLLSAAMLAVVVVAGIRFLRRHPRGAYWAGWVFVSLTPVLAFGHFGYVLMADRFLYIPSVGLALLLALGVSPFLQPDANHRLRRPLGLALGLVLLVLCATSWNRTQIWRNDLALFSDMKRTSPDSAMVRCNLGLAHHQRGEVELSVPEFRLAVELSPGYTLAHNNLAAALERTGRLQEALFHYERALVLSPGLPEATGNSGNLLVRLGRPAAGLERLRQLAESHPRYAQGLYALADALDRTGDPDRAMAYLSRVQALEPDFPEAHYLIGKIHADRGRTREAALAMRRFLELWKHEGEHARAARRIIRQAAAG